MNIIVLNSGSNGNAVYVESAKSGSAVLLDCGISRKQIEVRLKIHGRFIENIRAVFVTHEHQDHVCGLPVLSKIYYTPIYLTKNTHRQLLYRDSLKLCRYISYEEKIFVDDIIVQAFPKSHNAIHAVFFHVTIDSKQFLYVTDLGSHNHHLIALLPKVDALMLESNYDVDMLWNGSYPEDLKVRIDSDCGHLSNGQAMDLIEKHCDGKLKTLILGHLSENNNTPQVVEKEINEVLTRRKELHPSIHIASRYNVSDVITI